MKSIRLLSATLLLCLLISACGSSTKKGTVSGLVRVTNTNEMLAEVKLDDGKMVYAAPKIFYTPPEGGSGWKLAEAGQRVELELLEKATADRIEMWKILRVLEADK